MCDDIIDTTKDFFNEKKLTWKTKKFYNLLNFLSIIAASLMAVSIYCYLIKYRAKQNHFLPYHNDSKIKEIDNKNILEKWIVVTK